MLKYFKILILLVIVSFTILTGKQYPITAITVDDGLPQSIVTVILQDNKGFLWLGTNGGLARYDGVDIKLYTKLEGYPFFLIKGIIEKEPGTLWIADATEGLWELKNDVATKIIFDDQNTSARLNFIYQGRDGRILLGAEPGGLYIFNGDTISVIGQDNGLVSEQVISGTIDVDGNIWIGTYKNGAQKIVNGIPGINLTENDGFPADYVRYILARSNGEVWFGTKWGVYILDGNNSATLLNNPGEERFVFHILEEDENNMWISSSNNGGGLFHIIDKKVKEHFDQTTGLPAQKAMISYIDEYGTIFIGTDNGLSRISTRQFVNYSRMDGLIDPYITSVCQTSDGTIWVGTQNAGIHRLDEDIFNPLNYPESEKFNRIKHLLAVNNQVWCVTSRGLIILENGIPLNFGFIDSLRDINLRRLMLSENVIYVTGFQRLYKITGNTIEDITFNLKEKYFSFWGLEKDKKGLLWLSTNGQGLWFLKENQWINMEKPYPGFPKNFFGISRDNMGNLYFPASNGAYKWDGENFTIKLPIENTVWDILPTDNKGIWFGTSRGLYQKKNGQLNLFNMKSGLITSEFNISSFLEDAEGNLWFGGISGLVKYRKMKIPPSQKSPYIYILSVENKNRSFRGSESIVFEHNQNNITFRYTGIDWAYPERIRYRYKLDGMDKDWSSDVTQRFATYTNIPDGEYSFLVDAKGSMGNWSEKPATFKFKILKPWWKYLWVRLLFIFAALIPIWGVVKWRLASIKRYNLLLEEKIQERTSKLAETNIQLTKEIEKERITEEKLQQLKDFNESIIQSMAEGIAVMDKNGIIVFVNQTAESILDYEGGELIGKHWKEFTPPDQHYIIESADKRRELRIADAYEIELIRRNGKRINVFVSGSPRFEDGQFIGTIGVFADITDRKKIEDAIQAWQERYETVVAATGQIIYERNLETESTVWSGSIESILGYTQEEFAKIKDVWKTCIHPDDYTQAEKTIRKNIESTNSSIEVEYRFRHKNGSYRYILDRGLIVRDMNGKAIKSLGSMMDITIQKEAKEATEKAQRLQVILYEIATATSTVENLDDFYQSVRTSLGIVIDTSNFFIAFFEEEEQLMTFPYFVDEIDKQPGPTKMRKTLSEYVWKTDKPLYMRENDILNFIERGLIDPNISGTVAKVWLGCPLKISTGSFGEGKTIGVIVVQSYRDPDLYSESDLDILSFVSDQIAGAIQHIKAEEMIKNSEKKYRILSEQLAEASQMKDLLLDIISHDLKNPAGVISGMADVVLTENPDDDAIQLIKDSSDDLLKVVENTTILSKVALDEEIEKVDLNLTDMIQKVGSEFAYLVKDAGMEMEILLKEPLIVKANPIIEQVFKNYVSNAIKYSADGKKIIIDSKKNEDFITILVKDFGRAVLEKDQKRIFERKTQLKTAARGRGLGLAIVKRIAEAHNGEVWVEAIKPHGNIFYLKIPV